MSLQTIKIRRYARHELYKHRNLQKISTNLYLRYCSLTGFAHTLPDFLIIGFPKCGTTSLFSYLIQHPCIFPPLGKEIDYFDRLYLRGSNWYKVRFPLKSRKFFVKHVFRKQFLTGEATPRYILHPHALHRVKKLIPNTKFVILLRNPIDRAISHHNMNYQNGYEYRQFEDAITHEQERIKGRFTKMEKNKNYYSWDYDLFAYLDQGIYVDKIQRWMDIFPSKQFLILSSEELLEKPQIIYHKVLQFLELPKWEPDEYKLYKKREYNRSKINPEFRKQLAEFFKPHNERLYQLVGKNFHWEETL